MEFEGICDATELDELDEVFDWLNGCGGYGLFVQSLQGCVRLAQHCGPDFVRDNSCLLLLAMGFRTAYGDNAVYHFR